MREVGVEVFVSPAAQIQEHAGAFGKGVLPHRFHQESERVRGLESGDDAFERGELFKGVEGFFIGDG